MTQRATAEHIRAIGLRLERHRERRKLSKEEVGRRIGWSGRAVGTWESGARGIRIDALYAMCRLYRVTVEELVSDILNGQSGERRRPS